MRSPGQLEFSCDFGPAFAAAMRELSEKLFDDPDTVVPWSVVVDGKVVESGVGTRQEATQAYERAKQMKDTHFKIESNDQR